jgi:uncharacterized peroxidase-related enzyme
MSKFNVHTLETAPENSRPALKKLKESVGMIPNLAGAMANSPTLIEAFESVRSIFQKSSFTPQEREVLSLTNAVQNGCDYCVAIHSTFALKSGVDQQTVDSIRMNKKPEDKRFGALFSFSKLLIEKRGQAESSDMELFIAAGFKKEQALDVVVGHAVSVLANYGRHITHAPLDEMLEPQKWTKLK